MTKFNQLSHREQEVVNLLLEGKSNKLIALALGISDRTVEFHLKNIYAKLQVGSRMELVVNLGHSTVAGGGQVTENGDRLNLRNWIASFAASLRDGVSILSKELKMKSTLNSNMGDEAGTMTFQDSIRICLAKYADFHGRASRPEFWWFTLFITLVAAALAYLSEDLSGIFMIAMLLPQLAVGTRRLRDSGKSPWWQLFLLVPIAGLITLAILWAQPPAEPVSDDKLPA
jgi:DNA-binding CsgD family transcriptional regulator